MRISVVVCTYNRPGLLPGVLSRLSQSTFSPEAFEVLIVDNSDDEADVPSAIGAGPVSLQWRIVRSTPPGLSRARNVGLAEARSDIVAYLDDDAEPSADWLVTLLSLFDEYPDAAAVGGPVLPVWPVAQPIWLGTSCEGYLSILERPERLLVLGKFEHLYGANMAFRKQALLDAGGFAENLGRRGGKSLLSNEELSVQDRLRQGGNKILYSADAVVFHHVHAERVDQGWLRRRSGWQAVSESIQMSPAADFRWVLGNFAKQASLLDVDSSLLNALVETQDPAKSAAQLAFCRSLLTLILDTRPNIAPEDLEQYKELFRRKQSAAANDEVNGPSRYDENLSGCGGKSLFSNEELSVQDSLCQGGSKILYSADAVVFHHVHADRVDQGWLRQKSGWQAVSDSMQTSSLTDFRWVLGNFAKQASLLDVDSSLLNALVETQDPAKSAAQLAFCRSLLTLILDTRPNIAPEGLEQYKELFRRKQSAAANDKVAGPAPHSPYVPTALGADYTLFFEPYPGHSYFYDTYAEAGPSHLIAPAIDPWDWSPAGLRTTRRALSQLFINASETNASVCLLTLDPFLHKPLAEHFRLTARSLDAPILAILHRLPQNVSQVRCLSEISREITIAVLAEEIADDVRRCYSVGRLEVVPHHPTIWRIPPSLTPITRVSGEGTTTFGLVGEIREGKGLELLLAGVNKLDPATKEKVHFLMGGKAADHVQGKVRSAFEEAGVRYTLALRDAPSNQYEVLNDLEYADMIRSLDVGLLLYQGPQRRVMSGVLPNLISAGAAIIATVTSYVGQIVQRNNLGETIGETPEAVAAAIARLADEQYRLKFVNSAGYKAYCEATRPEAAINKMRALLRRRATV